MSKKLLQEKTIRKFMKLANLDSSLTENFFDKDESEDEDLYEVEHDDEGDEGAEATAADVDVEDVEDVEVADVDLEALADVEEEEPVAAEMPGEITLDEKDVLEFLEFADKVRALVGGGEPEGEMMPDEGEMMPDEGEMEAAADEGDLEGEPEGEPMAAEDEDEGEPTLGGLQEEELLERVTKRVAARLIKLKS